MTAFDKALSVVLQREGGDTNDPRDPGGLTRWGIAQRMHPEIDVAALTRDKAAAFYQETYWNRLELDRVAMISERIAVKLFDIAVSQGQSRATRWLQQALNLRGHGLEADGVIGNKTLAALTIEVDEGRSAHIMDSLRMLSLRQRIARIKEYPSQVVYFEGWVLRSLDLDGRFS